MKTDFQNGDPLYAEDLNDNFVETVSIGNRVTSLEGNITISAVTQAQYDALTPNANVLYVIIPA